MLFLAFLPLNLEALSKGCQRECANTKKQETRKAFLTRCQATNMFPLPSRYLSLQLPLRLLWPNIRSLESPLHNDNKSLACWVLGLSNTFTFILRIPYLSVRLIDIQKKYDNNFPIITMYCNHIFRRCNAYQIIKTKIVLLWYTSYIVLPFANILK